MINLISLKEKSEWNRYVKDFDEYDSYYCSEYLEPFFNVENANICLLNFENKDFKICYPVLIKDISHDLKFKNILPCNQFFDIETPYGYGGPLVKNSNKEHIELFFATLQEWAKNNNIISQFFRFHPLLENHKHFEGFSDLVTFKKTVYIDLKDKDIIYTNLNDKCRNMIKKATKNNIVIEINNSKFAQEKFIELYEKTMNRNNASEYYFFNNIFFKDLFTTLGHNCNLFNAVYNGEIISSAIILEENSNLHYHLSAANREYMKFGANNLLLYKVAIYGAEKGYKSFHLGGGVEAEDGLFIFKKSFNKNGLKDFYIGRNIFDLEKYEYLMSLRKTTDTEFDINNKRMIGYRA